VYIQNPTYLWFGKEIGPTHIVTIVFFLLAIAAHFLLKHTRFGTNVYATGANINAARLSGVNTNRTIIGVYALVGMCASLAAIFISSRMMTAMPELGIGQEMEVIASVVIMTAFSGGVGDIPHCAWRALPRAGQERRLKLHLALRAADRDRGLIIIAVIVDTWHRRLAERMITRRRCEAEPPQTSRRRHRRQKRWLT
jgi:ribose/xylose/arabinose/galactoside ABC-type transport system permease subunit